MNPIRINFDKINIRFAFPVRFLRFLVHEKSGMYEKRAFSYMRISNHSNEGMTKQRLSVSKGLFHNLGELYKETSWAFRVHLVLDMLTKVAFR